MIVLMTSVFMVVPFIAAYNVANVGLTEAELPYIYFAGGLTTLFTAPLIGWSNTTNEYRQKKAPTRIGRLVPAAAPA